jgi:protein involved in ribonucleotide reduction
MLISYSNANVSLHCIVTRPESYRSTCRGLAAPGHGPTPFPHQFAALSEAGISAQCQLPPLPAFLTGCTLARHAARDAADRQACESTQLP